MTLLASLTMRPMHS